VAPRRWSKLSVLSSLVILTLVSLSAPSQESPEEVLTWSVAGLEGWQGGIFIDTKVEPNPGALMLARGLHLLWQARFDSGQVDIPTGVAIDSRDNIIVTGSIHRGRDLYWTIKYSPRGEVLWSRSYSTGTIERATDVAVDPQDNVIVVGHSLLGGYTYHLVKYDPQGRPLWSRLVATGEEGHPWAVTTDLEGNIIVSGFLNSDCYLLKYSPEGELIWARRHDGGGTERAYGVATDQEGNIIVVGSTNRLRYPTGDDSDYYIVKYDPEGRVLWERRQGGGGTDIARGVATDLKGNIIVTGYVEVGGDLDYYTLKYSPEGQLIWARRHDTGGRDRALAVATDSQGNIIVTGVVAKGEGEDYYTLKYDPAGRLLWGVAYDGSPRDVVSGVAVDSHDSIIVVGRSRDDYHLLKYSDGYLPEGSYLSPAHGFGGWTLLRRFTARAELHQQRIVATIESSDDRFATVKRHLTLELADGERAYDIRSLGRARYVRVRFELSTEDPQVSPLLWGFSIEAIG